eukprot:jgi/Chlat1/8218/Chrsp76S07666
MVAPVAPLAELCVAAAAQSDVWRLQRRRLALLPPYLAVKLFAYLLENRQLTAPTLQLFESCLTEVRLDSQPGVNDTWLVYLASFRHLRVLHITRCKITSQGVAHLAGLQSSLEDLSLARCSKVTDSAVPFLCQLLSLKRLDLSETGVSARGVRQLASLLCINSLALSGLPTDDTALTALAACRLLRSLQLWGSAVTDIGVQRLDDLGVTELDLSWTAVRHLPHLPALSSLHMSRCGLADYALPIGTCIKLRSLTLTGATSGVSEAVEQLSLAQAPLVYLNVNQTDFYDTRCLAVFLDLEQLHADDTKVGNDTLLGLVGLTKLQHLSLARTRIGSDGVMLLRGCQSLKQLSLEGCLAIDDHACDVFATLEYVKHLNLAGAQLRGLSVLSSLDLRGACVTESGWLRLQSLPALETLRLKGAGLTDDCAQAVAAISHLRTLQFQGAMVTDRGLQYFAQATRLVELDVRGCWLVSQSAVAALKSNLPDCVIRSDIPQEPAAPKPKQSPVAPRRYSAPALDERLRYSREQLLALQSNAPVIYPAFSDMPQAFLANA